MNRHLASAVAPGARLQTGRGDCAGVHHRVHRPVAVQLDGHHRVEGEPSGVDPEFLARLLLACRLTDQGKDKRLGDALDRELIIGIPGGMESAVGLDDAHGKEMARRPGQSRDIVCNLSLIDRLEPLICPPSNVSTRSAGGKCPVDTKAGPLTSSISSSVCIDAPPGQMSGFAEANPDGNRRTSLSLMKSDRIVVGSESQGYAGRPNKQRPCATPRENCIDRGLCCPP